MGDGDDCPSPRNDDTRGPCRLPFLLCRPWDYASSHPNWSRSSPSAFHDSARQLLLVVLHHRHLLTSSFRLVPGKLSPLEPIFPAIVLSLIPIFHSLPCPLALIGLYTMGWSIESILALLTLAITIPTSIIGTCAIFNWWRHRRFSKLTGSSGQSTADRGLVGLGDLELVPVSEPGPLRRFPRQLHRTASASLEEGVTSVSYYYIHYYGRIQVGRPAPQPWRW
ncbi:hypothetical protein ASPCAL08687 [Aspergillus calidoustus]|uniref:Uncharacterized protein n=1 Tax=Aspergillus calidoustus TaxID=454130 RepID=A0A0U5GSB3_ASPCI|nr:hypothetical protein ASPCAL08687 [Aspergillus calidoustus]